MKIGAITIGQAPRVDVTADIMRLFPEGTELLQRGGLDGLSREEIAAFAPQEGDYVLVSRLVDGSSVTFAERFILPRLQEAIYELEDAGCKFIMMFCTGTFPEDLKARHIPLIYPCKILERIAPIVSKDSNILCITPSPLQVEQCEKKWNGFVNKAKCISASPYGDIEAVEAAAEEAKKYDADLIILDCIGYSQKMKNMFVEKTGKLVLLPRTLLGRVAAELVDVEV